MMTKDTFAPELYRVCDANLNRLKEGIRVVEDIIRYKENNKEIASRLKTLRHLAKIDHTKKLLQHRDSINDVLRPTMKDELNRDNLESIIIANLKRAQESSRVLEELYKLENLEYSDKFKHIRYELYDLEKIILL